jgi:hypothetical protein
VDVLYVVQEMKPFTNQLFTGFFDEGSTSRDFIISALQDQGVEFKNVGRFIIFQYDDDATLHVTMGFGPTEQLSHVSISLGIEGDERGWQGWSKEREMTRLDQQTEWMRKNEIEETSSGSIRISNTFSPQDGSSSITITKEAEQAASSNR